MRERTLPGEAGTWVFLMGDMLVFGIFFSTFLVERAKAPEQFDMARRTLHTGIGATNTFVLLTSSLMVVIAIGALRSGRVTTTRGATLVAMGCGAAFVGLKTVEYTLMSIDHHGAGSGTFYLYYFVLTGLHLVHVCLGLAALAFIYTQAARPALSPTRAAVVEGASCFWHLVDLLWVVLFPLLYLVS
ncbi:cytochrome C oxidase subunit III [Mycobacterium sp. CBMA 234]|uniref:cytochrome c oxidase subunit 3 n=1 Tax=Mycolicibacterium sp. CBMA 234 TaxID=1918495 RepID=UPI0012DC17E4|nr:cytochrome c oxidase subunit 3 [Mycolicibacterium sp. CBMA 234]MUL64530.1 cytochrome C oxidase subunit III [Mycolicibacterium sp. CBMA 234]